MEQLMLSAVRVPWQNGVLAASAVAGHSRIVLDLERLVFCDASGLRALIRAKDRAVALGAAAHGGCDSLDAQGLEDHTSGAGAAGARDPR